MCTIILSKQANISQPRILAFCGLLSLGGALGLLFITLSVAKIFLLITIPEFAQILELFLQEVTKNPNYVHTLTSCGTEL
jgi:hypothetical protein